MKTINMLNNNKPLQVYDNDLPFSNFILPHIDLLLQFLLFLLGLLLKIEALYLPSP